MNRTVYTFLFLLVVLSQSGISQNNNEMKYLFDGNQKVRISGFGGPFVEFSSLREEFGVMVGGGGGLLINRKFFVGGYGMGLSTSHYWTDKQKITGLKEPKISFGHGGFILGYIPDPYSAIHFSFSSMIGWGTISLYDAFVQTPEDKKGVDNVFVGVPKVEAEFNITRWFKMNVGFGYRFVAGIDKEYRNPYDGQYYQYYSNTDFNSPVANISLLFGGFGDKPAKQTNNPK
ncbi:MAG: hypothetical protein NTU44_20395 [Bacteroidetes bacterium]|nr:hypothetical protein [Bacteroidota bacterium]